jgi:NTE family protein
MDVEGESNRNPTCILVLQGGGAMAAYHVGAFQALREHAFEPGWVCGISMGAINGAIIAGNAPDRRLERLEAFWEAISRPSIASPFGGVAARTWEHTLSYAGALTLGQPGFFCPRPVNPYLAPPGIAATSFYDTTPLYATLEEMVAFDRLNQVDADLRWRQAAPPVQSPGNPPVGPVNAERQAIRLSVGATNVETGELVFFDTHQMRGRFGPEHIVASGSLPPGFPATVIDGTPYWDGGCLSNSPLQAVLGDMPTGHAVVFVIDLWSAAGPAPETMAGVEWRAKQIRYASVTPSHISAMAAKVKLREAQRLLAQPGEARRTQRLDIVHIIYHPGEDQIPASDAEFSRASIAERLAAGLRDMRRALAEQPWRRAEQPAHLGCLIHRVTPDGVHTLAATG